MYKQAYVILEKKGLFARNIAWHDYHMGDVAFSRGLLNQAKKWFLKSRRNFETIQEDLGLTVTLTKLGEVFALLGEFEQAENYLTDAVRIASQDRLIALLVDAIMTLGRLFQLRGEEKKAMSFYMLALYHPMCRWQTKDRVVALTLELNSRFSAEEVEGAQQWAKAVKMRFWP